MVASPGWQDSNGNAVGAVTWGNGLTGSTGTVNVNNSLYGSTVGDAVGSGGVTALTHGNYVVSSPGWQNPNLSGGAATWGNGLGGTVGPVSAANSLVGEFSYSGDIGTGVTALTDGNYVVSSPGWSDGATFPNDTSIGAATWGNGSSGTVGFVSAANSLVGSDGNGFDNVGSGITALAGGNYVVVSPQWHNGSAQVGAVTWEAAGGGTVGPVTTSNSLVGSTDGDTIGSGGVTALTNGNYVVSSPFWQNGAAVVGAVTWGNGSTGTTGTVGTSNSLVGSADGDYVGLGNGSPGTGVTALPNGNYVVSSPNWQDGAIGAVTWVSGTSADSNVVSVANSLVGSTPNDQVGSGGITALTNGNYVVSSPFWQNAGALSAPPPGPAARAPPPRPSRRPTALSAQANDLVSSGGVIALSDGNYVVSSPNWNNGIGAATWSSGTTGQHDQRHRNHRLGEQPHRHRHRDVAGRRPARRRRVPDLLQRQRRQRRRNAGRRRR